jgi:hypothetical protein
MKKLDKKRRNSKRKTNGNKFLSFAAFVHVALMLLVIKCLELLSFEIYTVLGSLRQATANKDKKHYCKRKQLHQIKNCHQLRLKLTNTIMHQVLQPLPKLNQCLIITV